MSFMARAVVCGSTVTNLVVITSLMGLFGFIVFTDWMKRVIEVSYFSIKSKIQTAQLRRVELHQTQAVIFIRTSICCIS
jgi:hypothetical protein